MVIGASGLDYIGIQCLKALSPAEIIVIDRSPEALTGAQAWGADHALLANRSQVAKVQEITNGQGAEAVIDFVGEGGSLEDGVAMLKRAGNYYLVGYGSRLNIPAHNIITNEINFIGNLVGSYNDLSELMTLTAQGKVTLKTITYPLSATLDALHDLESGKLHDRGIPIP